MIVKRNPVVAALSAGVGASAAGGGAVAEIMSAKTVLVIAADREIHAPTDRAKRPTTGMMMPRKNYESVGEALSWHSFRTMKVTV